MPHIFFVMLGGAIGAAGRHLLGRAMIALMGPGYPWGTLSANILGGLFMGLLVGILSRVAAPGESLRLFLAVGMLGGFTTFSSFSLDAVNMIERGAWMPALGYVLISVIASIGALAAGLNLVRAVA
ncbi:fluoride efflux transporter CrcB [Stakelama sp. CBK3Z-3]|uniref:Fluoride-specific ion channel FluC n=1 Tax=Stakelama flava TaxID=2860338 RepID=A0ABS6XMT2_9SPHN|nr:fluoride efflux transporter CrcB [Stakelama flava]MBW4331523.1 fluoride efflux transporter CrcB [Stakelama flava]